MAFDGNGNFELLYDFEADRDAGFPSNRILAEKMMDMFQDVATGLEDSAAESYARLTGTSTTSTAIGTGSKTFTTQASKAFDVGRWVLITSDADPSDYMHGRVTAYSGTSLTVSVTNIGGSGTLADWTITLSGTQGSTGATGATGGPAESFTFSTSTTDSDPGSGVFRLNHATPASATGAYVDNNNASGSDVSAWLDTFDDAGKTADRGFLYIYVRATPGTKFRVYRVTGSVTNGTGYRKLVLEHITGAGSFSASDVCDWKFVARGADGSGDVVGPSSSVDGEIALYNSTTGKLLKRATTTGLLKASSGVLAQAVAGTDYYNPGGTDVAIADGGTGQGTAALAFAALKQVATTSATGVVELATATETTTGTDTARAVTPDGLAGSDFGKIVVSILVFDDSQDVATGDGAGDVFWRIPAALNGYNLVAVAAQVQTAGTTNTTDIQIHNVTQAADMLSTKITIDSGETDSSTAATPAVIDAANDDVATGNQLRIDVDAVSTTEPKGLLVELTFQLP